MGKASVMSAHYRADPHRWVKATPPLEEMRLNEADIEDQLSGA
jgi:hypothetical protein